MCIDPVTALMVGGAVLSGAGQIMTGVENSKVAKMQGQLARQNADLALAQGAYQEQDMTALLAVDELSESAEHPPAQEC